MNRLEGSIDLLVYSDDEVTNDPQKRIFDYTEELSQTDILNFQSKKLQIADSVVDQVIEFDSIVPTLLFIFTDQEISIKLNGGSDITLSSFFTISSNITSLSISNSSGSTANTTIAFGA